MKKIAIVPFLLFCCSVFAQTDDATTYANHITGEGLKKHLSIIASDEMEGRETGTEGQRKAAAYIASSFKAAGLTEAPGTKGYQQFYPLYKDSTVEVEFSFDKKDAVYGTDFISPINSNEKGEFESDKIVFVGYGIEDDVYNDYAGLNVKGKVVAFLLGEPKKDSKYFIGTVGTRGSEWTFPGQSKKIALAAQKGAVGVIIINPNMASFSQRMADGSKTTNAYFPRESKDKKLNFVILSHAYAKTVFGDKVDAIIENAKTNKEFAATDYFEINKKLEYELEKHREKIMASNVLGVIEGSDKKGEYVMITAHYDHLGIRNGVVFNGADDDGSGTVSIMQIGEAFAKAKAAGKGPRRTVVIMAVSGEEKGLWGSEYYSDHPVFPLDKTTVDLNIDMVGRVDTERMQDDSLNYVYVVGHNKLSSDLPVINEAANNKYTKLVLDYKYDDPKDPNRIYFRSDHYNFARKGVPVLFFYDGMLKSDYHKVTDDIEKIYFPLMETRAKMIFYTAWEMANRGAMLKRDIPLDNATR